ncbi:MAG TPA: hypothetical protein VFY10_00830 [Dehalococcoidia bacterium]|nr:hypothetical protein [Dehalococcoidia bacterium]
MVSYVHARRLRHQPFVYLRLQIGVGLLLLIVMAGTHIQLPALQRQAEIVYLPVLWAHASVSAAPVSGLNAASLDAVLVLPPAYSTPAGPPLPPRTLAASSMYDGPGTDSRIVGLLPNGASLQVVGRDQSGRWLAVAFPPGSSYIAWLQASQVSGMAEQPLPKLMAGTSRR